MRAATTIFGSSPYLLALITGLVLTGVWTEGRTQEPENANCTPLHSSAITGDELSGALEILSWNIEKAGNPGWDLDLATLSNGINLAFIQEASLQAEIPGSITSPLHQAFAAGYLAGDKQTGVMTLSSASPSRHCNFSHLEPWLGTPKASTVTEYPLAGREDRLLTINLHSVNFAMGLAGYEQQLRSLMELLAHHQGPAILAGDLNTWSKGRQQMVDTLMNEHGLSPLTFQPDLRTTAFGRALDHIYVRGLKANFTQVIEVSSSDHNALRASLEIN